ncbi:fatty acid/phospholipid synthesis protein PlsX [Alicyclobacillus hesperidum URH17-3-68]|nr:phosphate acyltransferase PlsX [Alicyclobacillus hesperidum]EJY55859.1 fatty acid/phospholipid synthesis protein PlsX [Alicyclobacillus hesperidum URH17-3-68]KRW92372.1 phosphate acyltransferase [Alicyclobacillus tengchongensis]GLG01052.1 phosphate acyltransferase [Alicyclobacillus hesperidum subsp. aegles]
MITIVVDAMGGDYAPVAPVEGICEAAAAFSDTRFIVVGDEQRIVELAKGRFPANVTVRHTDVVIAGEEEPVRAVRRKPNSSLVMAAQMVANGEADVMVSAGNTGAIMAAGMLVIGRLPGVERPALAPILPTFDGKGVLLLDAGATMDASAENLLTYAYMADAYVKHVLDIENPRIGLLNVGTEDSKGNAVVKQTFTLLSQSQLHFIGNVEAREMMAGCADVVVCDGFVGNVVLKLAEGIGIGLFSGIREALTSNLTSRLGAMLVGGRLRSLRNRYDWAEHGGAPFLGVNGGCIKAHGSSNPRAWFMALSQARKFIANDLLSKLSTAMEERNARISVPDHQYGDVER